MSGVPVGWSKGPVTITLTAGGDLAGIASTEYRLRDALSWTTYAGPVKANLQGSSTYEYRSTDKAGNVETTKAVVVEIDALGPQTAALAKITVKKGKSATFRFRVTDMTPTATVTLKILKGKALKKTLPRTVKQTGTTQTLKWACKLAKGTYTWKVYATDTAGNPQRVIGWKTLLVK